MSTIAGVAANPPSDRRLTTIRIIASVMAISAVGFGLFTVVFGIVNPTQEPHAFHNAMVASLLLVLSAPPAIAVARAPAHATRPLAVLAVLAIAGLATMALSLTIDPFTLPFVVLIGVLWAISPRDEDVLPAGRPSPTMLVVVLLAAAPLVAYAIGQAELQRTDHTSSHADFFHWVETSFYSVAVLGLGLLAALRSAAYRLAAWSGGLALVVLGVASLLFDSYASALPGPWGWLAIAGGVAFIALEEWEARRPWSTSGASHAR